VGVEHDSTLKRISMKLGIVGITGRMGREVLQQAVLEKIHVSGALSLRGADAVGSDVASLVGLPPIGVKISDDAEAFFAASDVVIDFTRPQPMLYYASLAAKHKVALVSGTTGLDAKEEAQLQQHATQTPILWAANMSLGVNLLQRLTREAASLLGDEYDIEIVEMHHRHKIDAPSGTAKALGKAAAMGRGVKLEDVTAIHREGARKAGDIGFATLRGGDVVGDHTVVFAAAGERIELTHKASNRSIFAKGAITAARWLMGKEAGIYSMDDVLSSSLNRSKT
jgi:4-hydroxy-tetrahydrodipicolinate reductase